MKDKEKYVILNEIIAIDNLVEIDEDEEEKVKEYYKDKCEK